MNKNFNHSANHYAYGGMGCMYNFIYLKKGISRNSSLTKFKKPGENLEKFKKWPFKAKKPE